METRIAKKSRFQIVKLGGAGRSRCGCSWHFVGGCLREA